MFNFGVEKDLGAFKASTDTQATPQTNYVGISGVGRRYQLLKASQMILMYS